MCTPVLLESAAILKHWEGKEIKEVQEIKFYREIYTAGREGEPSGERHSKKKTNALRMPFSSGKTLYFSPAAGREGMSCPLIPALRMVWDDG